ncbi:MAG TPA: DinB family protein [Luteibacter sp.]|jgi:uncharacterized damage-inducible protein DinB|nr:DinB family protein [Luteibacter sp.]
MYAHYNAWANRRIYDAAGALSDAEYHADVSAFFQSMHGTLSHILCADRVWMRRFTAEGILPTSTAVPPYDGFAALRAAREQEDARILAYLTRLEASSLSGRITFQRVTTPEIITQPLASALAHFFNHQTHHRGQAHGLLSTLGKDPPELDLMLFERMEATVRAAP